MKLAQLPGEHAHEAPQAPERERRALRLCRSAECPLSLRFSEVRRCRLLRRVVVATIVAESALEQREAARAVELVGLGGLPAAGDSLVAVENEAAAREIAAVRQQLERERRASSLFVARSTADRESFLGASAIEALEAADDKLQVKTRVLRSGAGAVTSEDVMLASVSNAIVIGFNSQASRQTADEAAKAAYRRLDRGPLATPLFAAPLDGEAGCVASRAALKELPQAAAVRFAHVPSSN